jgi:hypothetical protein
LLFSIVVVVVVGIVIRQVSKTGYMLLMNYCGATAARLVAMLYGHQQLHNNKKEIR